MLSFEASSRGPTRLSILVLVVGMSSAARAAGPFDGEVAERRAELGRLAGRPEAIVPLLGILDLWNDVEDRGSITRLLDEAMAAKQLPDVRARAAFLRSVAADRLGDRARAVELRAGLGLLTDWWVAGPFDDEGRAGDRMVYAPEQELVGALDTARRYPGSAPGSAGGSDRTVAWRLFPAHFVSEGLVPLDAALRPDQHVLAYATTLVKVERDTPAAVRVGSSGAIKVWVNGRLTVSGEDYRPVRIDQQVGGALLRKGWNRVVVVKVGAEEAGWAYFVRLTAPDGKPIAFRASTEASRFAETRADAAADKKAAALVPSDLGRELKHAAESGDAAATRALGLYAHYVAAEDPSQGTAERLLVAVAEGLGELAPGATEAFRLAAMAAGDADKRRKLLEEAVAPERAKRASARERARALSELGEVYARFHRERRAEELWRQALAADPAWFPAAVHLAEQVADRGLPSRAQGMLDELRRAHPTLSTLKAATALADRRGQRPEAERGWGELARGMADDVAALRELFGYAKQRGDVDSAIKVLDRMAEARPDLRAPVVDRADLLDGVGRSGEAHATLAAALRDCPDDPRLLERDGRVLHRMGRDDEAFTSFRRALELRPQNPDLRAYLGELESRGKKAAGAGDDLAREYARPVEDLLEEARKVPAPHTPARVLLDLNATRVHPNGLSENFAERVVEILDDRGAREQGQFVIRYTPDTQSVEVKAARIYKKDGEVVEAPAETDQDTSEPWYGLYYDTHAQVIELPHLEPGDVVDVEYVVADVANRNMFADYFGDLHMLQEELPRLESEYILATPKGRNFYFNEPVINGAKVQQKSVEQGGERVYRVSARNVPRIEPEPGMPGMTSVGAYVHVSTYKTWEEVAEWYRGLVAGQLEPDDAIRAAVKDAVKGLGDEPAKIRAVYDLVVKSTRYVGLEFGIHGYKPYPVSQIFRRKFGDCKDKASLLVVMLKEIGVEASMVLARTRRNGDLDAFPASLAPFDHAIAWVPKYDLFLDGTAEFSGSGELPAQDQDIPVLLVNDPRAPAGARGHLARTPVMPAKNNLVTRELDVKLGPGGEALASLKQVVAGQAAQEWRNHYQAEGERKERFEKAENASHPGARVISVSFPSLEDLESPVEARAELEVPSWARVEGDTLVMPALGRESELLRSYARLSQRKHDLVLGYPWQQRERVTIALPPGWKARRLPSARRVESPFGTFVMTVEARGDKAKGEQVEMTTALEVRRHGVSAAEYPAFRAFLLDADRALGQELVVAHE